LLELENQVSKLSEENTQLEHEKLKLVEEVAKYKRQAATLDSELEKQKDILAQRDRELRELKQNVEFYQKEVERLSSANDSLGATNATLTEAFKKDIANVNRKYDRKREQLLQLSKEHSELQRQYSELQGGMEKMVRQEIKAAVEERDAEIEKLKEEVTKARGVVKRLQREALKMEERYLALKPDEYFPKAWDDFTRMVYGWCLKFSKQSERSCLSLHRIADDAVRDRVEFVMLDDNGVRRLLKDKARRHEVLTAVVMRIIRDAVFTRYMFGLTTEERQRLNTIEKQLGETGTPEAVNLWRANTLTLLSQRATFQDNRTAETGVVVKEIVKVLSGVLPQPTQLAANLVDELRAIVVAAVQLSIEMRTQRAQYMVPPPPKPVYDNNGDNVSRVPFSTETMLNRDAAGAGVTDEELEREKALVKMVVFPMVVRIGTQEGDGYDEEKVVAKMSVLVNRPGE
ncbi:hypothetical protein BDZ91DRAFT_627535, partial [Kalaharituber pfeilii]